VTYQDHIAQTSQLIRSYNGTWDGIDAESVARMRLQNRFQTGLDIARYTAAIMRRDMAAYDADPSAYTQSLGCWHGFIGQQKMISIKKHFGTTERRYLSVGLDGRRAAVRFRSAARSIDAREDFGSGFDRGTLHLPAPGRRA